VQLRRATGALLLLLAAASLAAGCGGGRDEDGDAAGTTTGGPTSDLAGTIEADGSSTVGPFTTAAAERFQRDNPGVRITVGVSGTGGGFERFCRGETDVSNASRPIKDEEKQLCEKNGVEYVEFHVANDALTVVVNTQNDWATCLTVEELKRIWEPGSKIDNWNEIRPAFPNEPLELAGAGTDSGTFDYFTDAIVGDEGASRSDYTASENDNVTVQAVAGQKGGLGYFGFSYLEENLAKLKALEVDGGGGCVAPSVETAQNGTYKPLSRPLFVYAKKESFERPEVEAFIRYVLDNETEIAEAARFVPLTDEQLAEARESLDQAVGSGP
jgi:phosphate transport system substrate-binding protein